MLRLPRTQLGPMQPGRNHARLHRAIHPGSQQDVSATVEDAHHVAIDDTTGPGIGRAHLQQAGFFHLLDHRHIAKRAIQKVVRLAGQKLQRKPAAPANRAAIPPEG